MTSVPTEALQLAAVLATIALLSLGFAVGAMWEGCRRGGTVDCHLRIVELEGQLADLRHDRGGYDPSGASLVSIDLSRPGLGRHGLSADVAGELLARRVEVTGRARA